MNKELNFQPFYAENVIKDENVMFVKTGEEKIAHLTFECKHVISLKNSAGKTFVSGKDFLQNGRTLTAISPELPFLQSDWLKNENLPEYFKTENETYNIKGCLLCEPIFYYNYFCFVTYEKTEADGLPDILIENCMPKTHKKLFEDKKICVALYGDSISNAANSAWSMSIAGADAPWYDGVTDNLKSALSVEIEFHNCSRSGYGAEWGASAVEEKFVGIKPDLTVIAFGMNDGAARVSSEEFVSNLKVIMEKIRKINSECEFLLISTPLPNPLCEAISGCQEHYVKAMKSLQQEGVGLVNLTALFQFLMSRKYYCEISGNNLNHPNDFSYRLVRDIVTETLLSL